MFGVLARSLVRAAGSRRSPAPTRFRALAGAWPCAAHPLRVVFGKECRERRAPARRDTRAHGQAGTRAGVPEPEG